MRGREREKKQFRVLQWYGIYLLVTKDAFGKLIIRIRMKMSSSMYFTHISISF